MTRQPTGFTITDTPNGWNKADFDDLFVRKDLFSEGNLFAWGNNGYGQLGTNNVTTYSSPIQVASNTNWKSISCGRYSFSGIKNDGTLWICGDNQSGQLGDSSTVSKSIPIQISGTWNSCNIGNFTLAIKTDGTLWAWGYNNGGQLGQNNRIYRSSPVQIGTDSNWKQISLDNQFCTGIKTDGTLWAWGDNSVGQLGLNHRNDISSPTQISGTNWKKVVCGSLHTLAIKTDGTLWAWGDNVFGKLGINQPIALDRSSPTQVGSDTNWKSISCGEHFSLATKNDGTLWAWGDNSNSQLGISQPTTFHRSSPTQVGSDTNWKSISCGYNHVLATKNDGTLWAWGDNFYKQLGNFSSIDSSSVIQITSNTNWKMISCSDYSSYGIVSYD